jgi:hypothetical protein
VSDDRQALSALESVPLDLPPGLEIEWLGVSGSDDFFVPLGERPGFVRGVKLSEFPGEVAAVSRDAQIAALPRVDV